MDPLKLRIISKSVNKCPKLSLRTLLNVSSTNLGVLLAIAGLREGSVAETAPEVLELEMDSLIVADVMVLALGTAKNSATGRALHHILPS